MVARKTRLVVIVGVMSALAWVLMALDFPLFIYFPSYLKIDFSDIPAIFGGMLAGPVVGIIIEFIKNVLHFFTMSRHGGIGEIANFCTGAGLVLPLTIIVRRDEKKMIHGFVAGIITMTITANLANYFITLPLYMKNPPAEVLLSVILAYTLPFNIIKGVIICTTSYFLYKALRNIINKHKI
ncbi:MAG: ECF transporter S component [Acetivibrionales bacterium]|jgi:riboflavin transporter FmnP